MRSTSESSSFVRVPAFFGALMRAIVLAAAVEHLPLRDVGAACVAWTAALPLVVLFERTLRWILTDRLPFAATAPSRFRQACFMALASLLGASVLFFPVARSAGLPLPAGLALFLAGGLASLCRRTSSDVSPVRRKTIAVGSVGAGLGAGAVAIGGLLAGGGLGAIAAGALVGGLLEAGVTCRAAALGADDPSTSYLRRAGWRRGVPRSRPGLELTGAAARLDLLLLAVWHGLEAAGIFGLVLAVTAATAEAVRMVAIGVPEGGVSRRHFVLRLAFALPAGAMVFLLAPALPRLLPEHGSEAAVAARILAGLVVISPLHTVLETWLHTKAPNRVLERLDPLLAGLRLGLAVLLVPPFGLTGAAAVPLVAALLEICAFVASDFLTSGTYKSPLVHLLARIPAVDTKLKAQLEGLLQSLTRELSAIPGVVALEVRGRAADAAQFVPGESDIDVAVCFDEAPHLLLSRYEQIGAITSRYRLPGPVEGFAEPEELRRWSRGIGRVILVASRRRILWGSTVPEPDEPLLSPRMELVKASKEILRLQSQWLCSPGANGEAARAHFAKCASRFELHPSSSETTRSLVAADDEPVAAAVQRLLEAYASAAEGLGPTFGASHAESAPVESASGRLAPAAREIRPYVDRLKRSTGVEVFELIPVASGADWPALLGVLPEAAARDPVAFWSRWRRSVRRLGPCRALWDGRWPALLPPEAFAYDVFLQHGMLLHHARPSNAVRFGAPAPPGRRPPADLVQETALLGTIRILARIPYMMSEARRLGAADLYIRDLVSSRCPTLGLLLDHGEAPVDLDELASEWKRHQDGPLARLLEHEPIASAPRGMVLEAIGDWSEGRMPRVRELVAP